MKSTPLDLANASVLKSFLARHELSASKGLGQHFLVSSKVVDAIVSAVSSCSGVLEIGPGPGVLTSRLSAAAQKMIALEVDERMISALRESAPSADVRKEDALEADLSSLLGELPESRAVVSNLPYYITGPLITRIAEAKAFYSIAVLMMQKEVADRVVAKPKTSARGSLSAYLQLQFEVKSIANAPAGAFMPPPKVDSAVLSFVPRRGLDLPDGLFKLIRFGFGQPRKTLANNLVAGYHVERAVALSWISEAELGELARPQELSNEEWVKLAGVVRA